MKHLVLTLALVAAVAGTAGVVSYRAGSDKSVQEALAKRDALEWLRVDFNLTAAQFAAIKRLHDSYSVVCEEHCRAIQEAAQARSALQTSRPANPAALAAAEQRVQELRLVCESAIATHVRQCAEQMSAPDAQRYLALVLPKIKDFDHLAPPDLTLSPHPSH
jgi:hypothetical protein